MIDELASKPGRGFWIISIVALVWNLLGIMSYIMQVSMTPEQLAAMQDAERLLYTDIPAWVTGAYAIAVFGGTLGSIGLLLRKAWAVPVFVVSLVAIVIQMGHALLMTNAVAVLGPAAAVMPIVITAIAVFLVWYAQSARKKGWLH